MARFYSIFPFCAMLLAALVKPCDAVRNHGTALSPAYWPGSIISKPNSPSRFSSVEAGRIVKSVFVDHNGHGNFSSIQKAINSVPEGNVEWIRIHVAAGIYREKVSIPATKGHIMLEGEGREDTSIEWLDYRHQQPPGGLTTFASATFSCNASDFIARRISFKNNYKSFRPAVAAQVSGDRASFYDCGFVGLQDTLDDQNGRHYYQNCYVEGAVDYIFGHGRSIFQGCRLFTSALPPWKFPGTITAQGRDSDSDDGGFVFRDCTVDGVTPVYLGRAWRARARVIYFRTYMSSIVVSEGWDAWNGRGQESRLTLIESECTGPGANRTGRVPWSRGVSAAEIGRFTSITYISPDGWLQEQPS